jgi:formylglycine-generating enzyme required for sulfatase activity
LADRLDLAQSLAELRRGKCIPAGKHLLIVIDQFEQWLHAQVDMENTMLVQALRQCDGRRVQCIVLVRDDFWMAATRWIHALEVDLVPARNTAAIDLFDLRHARKVLIAFGRAFGSLPEHFDELSKEHRSFVDRAIAGLAQDNKVTCVRLALFAEMMKGRPWTPASLKEVGGTEGIGVTFLEEMFSSEKANPEHRYHEKAARALLRALLPEAGAEIKGHMRSQEELLEACGYRGRPKDFDALIRTLDGELRLITPSDAETGSERGPRGGEGAKERSPSSLAYYQLTHDYLVPSLRGWLTRKQQETRRGRAELLLADRAGVWSAHSDSRQLPSLLEWLRILGWVPKSAWTPVQRRMMRHASTYHWTRCAVTTALLLCLLFVGMGVRRKIIDVNETTHAEGLVSNLLNAEIGQVPEILSRIEACRDWANPLLHEENARASMDSQAKLRTSLALLPVDNTHLDYLSGRLLVAEPAELPVLRDALAPYKQKLLGQLWTAVEQEQPDKEHQRLRAACALASYDADSPRWQAVARKVADDLVSVDPIVLGNWSAMLSPVKAHLTPPLSAISRDRLAPVSSERTLATNVLAVYAADQPDLLADLLMEADDKQFAALFPKVRDHRDRGANFLTAEIVKRIEPGASEDDKEKLAKRQANAAVALLKLNRQHQVWTLLAHSSDPRARSYLIHRLPPLSADPVAIVSKLEEESDVSVRRALVLSLGEFAEKDWRSGERAAVGNKLRTTYQTAEDAGLHAACEWLLRSWKHQVWLSRVNEEWKNDPQRRDSDLIEKSLAASNTSTPRWYVNAEGQTMVVIPTPGVFVSGSPPHERDRMPDREAQHQRRISRTYAIASKPVTLGEYRRFARTHKIIERHALEPDCPAINITWYDAARYCNWLSDQEGIDKKQWCYEVDVEGKVVRLRPNYLSLKGYRLPSEAEMEYAIRAGARTSRCYGESEELLGEYAWYASNSQNRSRPVGTKKPNDFGLFDMHGNVWCWCQERFECDKDRPREEPIEDREDPLLEVRGDDTRTLRCGAFFVPSPYVRSAHRFMSVPSYESFRTGFRTARTISG